MNLEQIPWRTTLVALAAALIYAVAGPVPEALLLDKGADLMAQPWTLVTTHLLHTDPGHLLWDCLGLLLVGVVFEPLLKARLWAALALGVAAIDVGFFVAMPDFQRYCGLSGLINAVAGAGLVAALLGRERGAIAFGLLIAGKVLLEQVTGAGVVTQAAWPTAQQAHAAGLLAGLAVGPLMGIRQAGRGAGDPARLVPPHRPGRPSAA
ncbi:MAG: rhombosortase [Thiohalocapsa sp.]|nr:rhombosortase [Thiohalocapsa sp.]